MNIYLHLSLILIVTCLLQTEHLPPSCCSDVSAEQFLSSSLYHNTTSTKFSIIYITNFYLLTLEAELLAKPSALSPSKQSPPFQIHCSQHFFHPSKHFWNTSFKAMSSSTSKLSFIEFVRYFSHVKIMITSHNENLYGLVIYTSGKTRQRGELLEKNIQIMNPALTLS